MEERKRRTLEEITNWELAVIERAEKAEEKLANEILEKINKEQTEILETEWGELSEFWKPLIPKFKYKIKVIEYLKELQLSVEKAADSAIDDPYQLYIDGEKLAPTVVNVLLAKSHRENIKILEAEWAEYKDLWEKLIADGHTAKDALDFLKSFA